MHDDEHAPEEKGYELSDVQVKVILFSGVGVVLMTFAAFVISVFFIKYLNARGASTDYVESPLAAEAQDWDLDVRLQTDPPAAQRAHKSDQRYRATTYGTVSQEPEIYHIPIETAMDIVVESGLPAFVTFLPPEEE